MFSKALFKQTCKANGLMWAIITIAVCFMLACVMLISGSGNISAMTEGISDTIIDSTIEAYMKKRAINYYEISSSALNAFDKYYMEEYAATGDPATAYVNAINKLSLYTSAVIESLGYEAGSSEAQEIEGVIFFVLNPNHQFDAQYTAVGETAPAYDLSSITSSERQEYISDYARNNSSIFLAANMINEENIDKILNQLAAFKITLEKYAEYGYAGAEGYQNIKSISQDSLVTYIARYNYEFGLIDTSSMTELEIAAKQKEIKNSIESDITSSFISTLPKDVSDGLSELGEMDMYSMIIGSIFFKMAGLLLPIIYMIMVANNMIAGQVDSGSMAYILSTSTKRKQVVFTQALYLVSSLFAMFALTTITSVVCLKIVNLKTVELNYVDLILLNLGAFLTMFAMSGISFMASCLFNRSKHSMSIGGGLNMFFLVASMLGLFGSKIMPSVVRLSSLNFFNYVTIISLFDADSILAGTTTFIWKLAILAGIGIICYLIGSVRFQKKDLPL
ncbi:MAG: ABC transporter permease [Firmicutes bacterium]|nr:ABC transporter permease [Bacillota bacterium]